MHATREETVVTAPKIIGKDLCRRTYLQLRLGGYAHVAKDLPLQKYP